VRLKEREIYDARACHRNEVGASALFSVLSANSMFKLALIMCLTLCLF